MAKIINQETLVPIGIAIIVIGSASVWVTEMKSQIKINTDTIEILKKGQEDNFKLNHEINSRLSRLEWKLEETK